MIAEKGVTIGIHVSEDEVVYIQPEDVKSVDIVQECDKVSKTIPESYGTAVIKAQENFINKLSLKTLFVVYFDGKPKMNLYVETARNRGVNEVEIKGKDLFFIYDFLKTTTFHWIQAPEDYFFKNAYEVFDAFFQECGVPYEIDDSVKALTVNGVIEKNKPFKDVLLSLLFASGARVVAGDKFYVRALGSSTPKIIKPERIIGSVAIDRKQSEAISLTVPYEDYGAQEEKTYWNWNQSSDDVATVEGPFVDEFKYSKSSRTVTVQFSPKGVFDQMKDLVVRAVTTNGFDGVLSYEQLSQVIREPYYFTAQLPEVKDLGFGKYGEYVRAEVRYGIYNETPEKGTYKITSDNPYATSQSVANLQTINSYNVEEVANRLYNDDILTEEIRCAIVERKLVEEGQPYKYGELMYGSATYGQLTPSIVTYDEEINVGDTVEVDLNKLGMFQKVVTKQRYTLNGGIIVKDSTLR